MLLTKTFAEHQIKSLALIGTSGEFADPTDYALVGAAAILTTMLIYLVFLVDIAAIEHNNS